MYHKDQFHVRVQLPSFGRVGAARAGVTTITGGVDRDHPTTMVGQPTIVPHAVVDAGAGNLHVGERPGRARNLFRGAVRAEMIDGAEQTFLGRGRGPSHTDVPFVGPTQAIFLLHMNSIHAHVNGIATMWVVDFNDSIPHYTARGMLAHFMTAQTGVYVLRDH